ncbi:MAG: S8 family serine peptidase [Flavobacteriales bacterium]
MKLILLLFTSFILILNQGISQLDDVSGFEQNLVNWHLKNISSSVMGTNTQKTYDEIIGTKPAKKKIIVAVIDAGVDIYHEDLRENIWTNTAEIAGNAIDDDKNGYIDDVHGWNFLGNAKGENIDRATLEKTRILRKLAPKYGSGTEYLINENSKREQALYDKLKAEIDKELKEINDMLPNIKAAKKNIADGYLYLSQLSGKPINTVDDLRNLEPANKDEKKLRRQLLIYSKLGLTKKGLADYEKQLLDQKEANLNVYFNPRKEIIGDDLNNIADRDYGNPNVIGPDAMHGTFCAGIIGATINNGKGINGVANNVLIMPIRAVPNGDEYDKDVALAIRYAVDNGANIINMSFGKSYSASKEMVDEAFLYAESKGVLLVQAAGNSNENIDIEPNFPSDSLNNGNKVRNHICVGASTISTKKRLPAEFSNYGNRTVDIFAPGLDIISTTKESQYENSQGTSFSAPLVSGVAALVWSYYPELTVFQLKELILKSATPVGRKKVRIPGGKKKTRFRELCVSDGIVNTYNAFVMAEAMTKK